MPASPEFWWSALLGGLIGVVYTATSVIVLWLARRTDRFVMVVCGGILLRMVATLVVLVLVLLYVPVATAAFVGAFLCVTLIGIFAEVIWLYTRHN